MATLQEQVDQLRADLAALKAAAIGADPSGKVTVRSIIVREYHDAGEIIRQRVMMPQVNGEDWGDGLNTIYVDTAEGLAQDGQPSFESTWHPKHPEPNRHTADVAYAVGKPSSTNHGGKRSFFVQRRNRVGDIWEVSFEVPTQGPGRISIGHVYDDPATGQVGNAHRANFAGGGAELPANNGWLAIGHERGLLVVTNLTDGRSGLFLLDHHGGDGVVPVSAPTDGTIRAGGSSEAGDGSPGEECLYVNLNPQAWQHGYRIINRHTAPKVVSWALIGGLQRPL